MKVFSVSGVIANYEITAEDEQEAVEKFLSFVNSSPSLDNFEDIRVEYMGEREKGDDIEDAEYEDA